MEHNLYIDHTLWENPMSWTDKFKFCMACKEPSVFCDCEKPDYFEDKYRYPYEKATIDNISKILWEDW